MSSQSDTHGAVFSAAELEFLAEDEMIEIVPNLKMKPLSLICGDFGSFQPQIPTQVPIWLAVALKKRGKCSIRAPDWMSVENLTKVLEAERDSSSSFEALPFHYVEISRLLFDHARDDISEVYMVRSLIEDIKDVRFHKIGTGLEKLSSRTYAMKLNLSAMEVNVIRPFVTGSLETFYELTAPDIIQESERQEYRRPQTADRGPRHNTIRPAAPLPHPPPRGAALPRPQAGTLPPPATAPARTLSKAPAPCSPPSHTQLSPLM
ncbi:hypothetical protein R6Q57_027436 [Mikania cordata]